MIDIYFICVVGGVLLGFVELFRLFGVMVWVLLVDWFCFNGWVYRLFCFDVLR